MAQRRIPAGSGPRSGQFAKVRILKDKLGTVTPKGTGGFVYINTKGLQQATEELRLLNARVTKSILEDPDKRADLIQARLRLATAIAYNKSATGRVSRGIFAKVQKVGTADGKGVQTAIVVTMVNYRESKFLTNLGGEGYFRSFPVAPYRIYAKGAISAGIEDVFKFAKGKTTVSKVSTRRAISFAHAQKKIGRLKVPRGGTFFKAGRMQGRGGAESRVLHTREGAVDFATPDASFPNLSANKKGDFFFYPLWVNHPGFAADVISDIVLQEGGSFTTEATNKTIQAFSELQTQRGVAGAVRIPDSDVVASGVIPLPGTEVRLAAESNLMAMTRGLQIRRLDTSSNIPDSSFVDVADTYGLSGGGGPNVTINYGGRRRF